jgi:glycosyltransferase involved in cell wall biosynthesis
MEKKRIVFLYTEIANYFLACVSKLMQMHPECEVHIVRLPVNKEAPFAFKIGEEIRIYDRKKYNNTELLQLIGSIQPHLIICSGWVDKGYLMVCRKFKRSVVTVLTLDNHWRGDLKQRIASLISPFFLLDRFSKCWVPGEPQYQYALKLGFKKQDIGTGYYSCDFDFFHEQFLITRKMKEVSFPKRFIFIGRYYEFKGIKDLWQAFIDLQSENRTEWELWCLGTGDIEPIDHPSIMHFGFIQPEDLPRFIKETGVFVLPSHFEPWGVVVHEFAAAGFPIICSDKVGSRILFVENNFNGYIYKAGQIDELKQALSTIMNADKERLLEMSDNSVKKAKQLTSEIWAKQLISFLNG